MTKIKKLVLVMIFLTLGSIALFWHTFQNQKVFQVKEIIDGDTIRLENGKSVRLINIDAPEEEECYSQQAKELLNRLLTGKKIRIEQDVNEMDRFGRWLAYLFLEDEPEEIFVNEYLLKEGAAEFFLDTVNLRYQSRLVTAAKRAHEQRNGLWSFCAPDPKTGCQIKGNLDKNDVRFYHLPNFRHYPQVVVNLEAGDRWFCTEKQAQEAGFQRARE